MFYSLENIVEIELWFQNYYGKDNMYHRFVSMTSQYNSQLNSYTVNGFEIDAIAILFCFPNQQGQELIVSDDINQLVDYLAHPKFSNQPGYDLQIKTLSEYFEELKVLRPSAIKNLCLMPIFLS